MMTKRLRLFLCLLTLTVFEILASPPLLSEDPKESLQILEKELDLLLALEEKAPVRLQLLLLKQVQKRILSLKEDAGSWSLDDKNRLYGLYSRIHEPVQDQTGSSSERDLWESRHREIRMLLGQKRAIDVILATRPERGVRTQDAGRKYLRKALDELKAFQYSSNNKVEDDAGKTLKGDLLAWIDLWTMESLDPQEVQGDLEIVESLGGLVSEKLQTATQAAEKVRQLAAHAVSKAVSPGSE